MLELLKQDGFWVVVKVFALQQEKKNCSKTWFELYSFCAAFVSCGVDSAILLYLELFLELYIFNYHYSYHPWCEQTLTNQNKQSNWLEAPPVVFYTFICKNNILTKCTEKYGFNSNLITLGYKRLVDCEATILK